MGRNLFLSVFCAWKKAEYVRKSTEDSIRFPEKESIIKEEKM